jgi:hypothetical protein
MKLDLDEVFAAIEETTRDLMAFRSAFNTIHNRVQQVKDEGRDGPISLVAWAGTDAVTGSLTLCIHAIEGRRNELLRIRKHLVDHGLQTYEIED